MRIIAGAYRGKNLNAPASNDVRPTSDRAREAVYNILTSKIDNDWENYSLLDVFAGTGAFGLEAISRGAKEVCLLDKDTALAAKNASLFPKEQSKIKIVKADALNLPVSHSKYDMVFLDAPYQRDMSAKALEELKNKGWFQKGALCIIELEKKEDFILPANFEEVDNRKYGIARFIFAQVL
ncbi:MAG: 16S rRNA (guanine(966)-N(2))-methyltransferase RsmD [Lactobacillaceae bacterium]|jgi:16S rRNA (guanine966-N2)-methyltransferase|nr:16S rRNA (guanine(966)-N(2))-methyltransferase RsmD [Lactobacillaceae bacterium]